MSCSPSAAAKINPDGVRGFPCVLDVITADPLWQAWSEEQLSRWLDRGPLLINPIVYAEIAFACEAIETVDDLLTDHLDVYRLIPREAAFLAARAHAEYRARPAA
jgi:predicted nucleic acid-binding protein